MPSTFHEGNFVALELRPVGDKQVQRVRLVVNSEKPQGFYFVPKWKLNPATGEMQPIGHESVPVEIIPQGGAETVLSREAIAAQWIASFTPAGNRKDPSQSFQE